jgi:hypothetical protein
MMCSIWCATHKGVPLGQADPATHTHRRSHPKPSCWENHRDWLSIVAGCSTHNGAQDGYGEPDITTGGWRVPPCHWCRREIEEGVEYPSIGYDYKHE